MILENIKTLLGFETTDTSKDKLLNLIISNATSRLKVLLGGLEPPTQLDYILVEVSVIRFNRIGSEGASSHSVDGESLTFSDKDFEQFTNDIQAYLDSQKDSTKGKVRFI